MKRKPISKQLAQQRANLAAGKCRYHKTRDVVPGHTLCPECVEKTRGYYRMRIDDTPGARLNVCSRCFGRGHNARACPLDTVRTGV